MKNSIKMISLAGILSVGIAIASLTGCRVQSNLDKVIENLQTCSKDDNAREYATNKLKEYHEETNKKDLSQLNQHYHEFLELSNKQKLEELSKLSKERYGGCDVYKNVKNITDEEASAFYNFELSVFSPF